MNIEQRIWIDQIKPVGNPHAFVFLFLLFLVLNPASPQAQVPQTIYTGLDNPTSLYVHQGVVYIVEKGKNRLLKLSITGKFLETIGGKGSGDYEFDGPVDVHATNGLKIYVTDYRNRRVQLFDRRGQYLGSLKAPSDFNNRPYAPTQIAVNDLGEVFFVDENNQIIQWHDLDGNRINDFSIPAQINKVDDLQFYNRSFYILDKKAGAVHILNESGMYSRFLPVEKTEAFVMDGRTLVSIGNERITWEDGSPEPREISLSKEVKPVDAFLDNNVLYILGKKNLYKLSLGE